MASKDWATEAPRTDEMILRCKAGHEYIEFMTVPMNLTAYGQRLKGMNWCRICGRKGVEILLGEAYEAAKRRLTKAAS